MSKSVYANDSFRERVAFAAAVISRKGTNSRGFDTCLEMYDGHEVAAALVRRAKARPDGALAQHLFDYISKDLALEDFEAFKHLSNKELEDHAAATRSERERQFQIDHAEWLAKQSSTTHAS